MSVTPMTDRTRCKSPQLTFDNNFSDLEDEDESERPESPTNLSASGSHYTKLHEAEKLADVGETANTRFDKPQSNYSEFAIDGGKASKTQNISLKSSYNVPERHSGSELQINPDANTQQSSNSSVSFKVSTNDYKWQHSNDHGTNHGLTKSWSQPKPSWAQALDSSSPQEDRSTCNLWVDTLNWQSRAGDQRSTGTEGPVLKLRTNDTIAMKTGNAMSWSLDEEDLYGPITMGDASHISDDMYPSSPSTSKKKDKSYTNHAAYACYMRRSTGKFSDSLRYADKTQSSAMPMSPLAMVAKMAKQSKMDPTVLMQQTENIGFDFLFPCMQCYERSGYTSMRDDSFEGTGLSSLGNSYGSKVTTDGRCQTCGGQVMSISRYGKMLQEIRAKITSRDLIACDAYPDGNCQFSAIVHQLRMEGDFSYTPLSLRQMAVEYLRHNPNAEDGTPLLFFLTDGESWDEYLTRMSYDGEWGDHMVLTALASVLNKKIIIYGGLSGQGETVILPRHMIQTSEKDTDQNDHNQDSQIACITLGHLGESHYLSFCPRTWQQNLIHKMTLHAEAYQYQTEKSRIPLLHINCLVKQILHLEYVRSHETELFNVMTGENFETFKFTATYVGSLVCQMQPEFITMESMIADISMFLPSQKIEKKDKSKLFYLYEPKDTKVVFRYADAGNKDVILEDSCESGLYWCIPRLTKMWPGQTTKSQTGRCCLNFFPVTPYTSEDVFEHCPKFAFHCDWPIFCMDWLQRDRKSNWPEKRAVEEIVSFGCQVIPLQGYKEENDIVDEYIPDTVNGIDHLWMISFAVAEKQLSHLLSDDQRQCFLLFQLLIDLMTKEIGLPKSVPRAIFFYACENLNPAIWKDSPGECLLILLKNLANGLCRGRIPHYFMAQRNLLRKMPHPLLNQLYEKIEVLRHQPLLCIYLLLEENNLMASEIGLYLNNLIIDTFWFARHGDVAKSFKDSIIPASSLLIKCLVYESEYQLAIRVLQNLRDFSYKHIRQELSMANLIEKTMQGTSTRYQWCMSLYMDILEHSTSTNELFARYESIHITEIFGPEIMDELPNVIVPACYNIDRGDLSFVTLAIDTLSEAVGKTTALKCLKYYLQAYNSMTGDLMVLPNVSKKASNPMQHMMPAIFDLMNLHCIFFNLASTTGKTEEFRSFLPKYQQLVAALPSPSAQNNLSFMMSTLGCSSRQ